MAWLDSPHPRPQLTKAERQEARTLQRQVNSMQKPPRPNMPVKLRHLFENLQGCFILTDPWLPDNPIVFASEPFLNLTG